MKKMLILVIVLILVAAFAAWGPIVSRVEQAKYNVVQKDDAIEIRDYDPMIVAEVEVSGDRKAAINAGFRMIADYIFGNNIASIKVPMTAPVTQQSSEKIAMTAPVTQQGGEHNKWKVNFVMPRDYTMATLPTPRNKEVKLLQIPAKRYVVIRFSGIASQAKLQQEQEALEAFIAQHHLKPVGAAIFAFYNPPWTLPFLRRNEVMIEVKP